MSTPALAICSTWISRSWGASRGLRHRVTGDRRESVSGIGWEYLQVAIDDHSRIAFSAIYPDEKQTSVLAFLAAALAYYARCGISFRLCSPTMGRPTVRAPSLRPATRWD